MHIYTCLLCLFVICGLIMTFMLFVFLKMQVIVGVVQEVLCSQKMVLMQYLVGWLFKMEVLF